MRVYTCKDQREIIVYIAQYIHIMEQGAALTAVCFVLLQNEMNPERFHTSC